MTLSADHGTSGRKRDSRDDEIHHLEGRVEALKEEISELRREIEDLEDCKDRGALEDGINDLLDEVERPVGTTNPTLPATPAARRALLALYDLVGRTL